MAPERIAVIADIHGNTWALDAVLADIRARGVSPVFNLGDSAYGSLDPAGAVDRLIQAAIPGVTGNQDRIIWDPPPAEQGSADHRFVTASLGPERIAWLQARPATADLGEVLLCHGTPARDDTYLLESVDEHGARLADPADILSRLAGATHPVVLCGHSHVPRTVWLPGGRLVVNPGSVGISAYTDDLPHPHAMEAGSPHARYAILGRTAAGWSVEHVCVPYPWWEAAAAARRQGRADRARWIETGRAH